MSEHLRRDCAICPAILQRAPAGQTGIGEAAVHTDMPRLAGRAGTFR
jgi:hypothetical protein